MDIDLIKSGRINEENFLGAVLDHERKQLRVYTNDMLVKRYKRDSSIIAESFDKLCDEQMLKISKMYSQSVYRIGDGFLRSVNESNEIGIECGKLLLNAIKTITASVELLRNGYILQPGMILRSVIETFSLISYILIEPEGMINSKKKGFDINKTIKYGNKVLPFLGQFQGLLSNNFVHISELHFDFNNISIYEEMIEPLEQNIGMIKSAVWIVYVITELVYYKYFEEHIFWEQKNKFEFTLKENKEMSDWVEEFFV